MTGKGTGGAKVTVRDGCVLPNKSIWVGGTGTGGGALRYMVTIGGGGIGFKGRVNDNIKLEPTLSRNDLVVTGVLVLVRERSSRSSLRESSSSSVTQWRH